MKATLLATSVLPFNAKSAFEMKVELVLFADGERAPMLLDGRGIPIFDPTVWSLTTYRQKSASTVEQALRSALLVHLFCWRSGIDLKERVRDGMFLSTTELDALVSAAARPFDALRAASKGEVGRVVKSATKTVKTPPGSSGDCPLPSECRPYPPRQRG